MVVLTLLGTTAIRTVKGEIKHTGQDIYHIKAQFVAKSAINWALGFLANDRPGISLANTAATHSFNGTELMPDNLPNGTSNPRKIHATDVPVVYPGSAVTIDANGWITSSTTSTSLSYSGTNSESMAFKVWYPTDSTMRVSGKATVKGVSAQIEMTGGLKFTKIGI